MSAVDSTASATRAYVFPISPAASFVIASSVLIRMPSWADRIPRSFASTMRGSKQGCRQSSDLPQSHRQNLEPANPLMTTGTASPSQEQVSNIGPRSIEPPRDLPALVEEHHGRPMLDVAGRFVTGAPNPKGGERRLDLGHAPRQDAIARRQRPVRREVRQS